MVGHLGVDVGIPTLAGEGGAARRDRGTRSGARAAGLRSFSGSCGDGGRLLVPVATDNKDQLNAATTQLSADGGTPTPDALRAAARDLPTSGDRTIVLISDGQSSCGNPCAVAQEIKNDLGVDFRVHAVGVQRPDQCRERTELYRQLPLAGSTSPATNTDELAQAISTAVETTSPAECDDVYFVGVRGSGEEQDNPLEQYEAAAGGPVYATRFRAERRYNRYGRAGQSSLQRTAPSGRSWHPGYPIDAGSRDPATLRSRSISSTSPTSIGTNDPSRSAPTTSPRNCG